jgi:plastocyanin
LNLTRVAAVLRPLRKFVLVVAAGLVSVGAAASNVNVTVVDRAGRPLPDAVVMIEPLSGHFPVRPLTGVEIAQSHRQFVPQVTVVPVGTAISFPNRDTVRHHVYSFSAAKTFELKLYAGVPATPVLFDKPGVAVLGCNIHDDMVAWVVVVDTPFYARSGADGMTQIDAVPDGKYEVQTWHSGLADATSPLKTALSVEGANVQLRVVLPYAGAAK